MTDIEVYQPPPTQAVALLEIDSWTAVASQVIRLAKEIYDTPFVPDGLRGSVPAVAAAILAGRELGLGPMTSLANIHLIKGKPALAAILMRALIQSQGHQWQDIETSDTRAVIRGRRRGESEWTTVMFTADQAKHAGIQLGGYPQDKLYARATSRLARRKFADVIAGMPYSAEELEDGTADEGTVADDTPAAIEAPKPAARTARRRTQATATPAAPPATPAAAEAHGPAEPPLPGEDEPDPPGPDDAPEFGTERHRKAVGIVRAHFTRLVGKDETDEQRAERLHITSRLAGIDDLGSTSDLDLGELSRVADTLARCKNRSALDALLKDGETDG